MAAGTILIRIRDDAFDEGGPLESAKDTKGKVRISVGTPGKEAGWGKSLRPPQANGSYSRAIGSMFDITTNGYLLNDEYFLNKLNDQSRGILLDLINRDVIEVLVDGVVQDKSVLLNNGMIQFAGAPVLFSDVILSGNTQYVNVPIRDGEIGLHIGWKDATSSATITLQTTSVSAAVAPTDQDGAAWQWHDHSVSITGPSGAGADSEVVTLTGADKVKARRARLKIEASADTDIEVLDGT